MKQWQITVKIADEPKDDLILADINEFLEGYLTVHRNFFDELLNIVKMIKKYVIGKGIEKILGPDKKDWTHNSWVLVMFKDNEKNIPFWLLLKREKDLNGNLVAIGPEKFVDYCKKSTDPDDEIKKLMEYIVAYPQKFKVSIIIPNFVE
ncbi:hypothetical protein [Candidatus Lokiarchaeum ossiferum]|uniref:hypothetical protein n=1 Tax=Candidatus Lokiarchaeum ossiferum TaxID=2951803 RepID=UPI00352E1D8B